MVEDLGRYEVERAKTDTKRLELVKAFEAYSGVALIQGKKLRELEEMAADIDRKIAAFGSVNMRAIESYETLKKELEDVAQKLETLKAERQSIFDFMETVETKKRETFMAAFEGINANFERYTKN